MFRYDYLREPPAPHPAAHLQIRGALTEACLANGQVLDRIHFPTRPIRLEAVIRLLIDEFRVPANQPPDVWRRLLAESEARQSGQNSR